MAEEFDAAVQAVIDWVQAFPEWYNREIWEYSALQAIETAAGYSNPSFRRAWIRQAIREGSL